MTQTDSFTYRLESFTDSAVYTLGDSRSFDLGGGLRLLPQVGVGVAVSRYAGNERGVISFSAPHPTLFNKPSTASGVTAHPLKQQETSVHLEARYIANMPRASVSLFAGPTYFKVTREIVSDFTFSETLSNSLVYTVALTGDTTDIVNLSTWGMNAGADVGFYFTKKLGIGGLARYSRATVTLPNRLNSPATSAPINVGGLSVGGGLRVRF